MGLDNGSLEDDAQGSVQSPAEVLRAHLDVDAWRIYGDWLQEHGDPRGELIAVELELSSSKVPPARKPRLVLARDHLRKSLNVLPGRYSPEARPVWKLGHLEGLTFRSGNLVHGEAARPLHDLLIDPVASFLQDLSLELRGPGTAMDAFIETVATAAPSLRRLRLQLKDPSGRDAAPCNLEPLWPALLWLKDLFLQAERVQPRLGSIQSPQLETLDLAAPLNASLRSVATAKWPRLCWLHLGFRDPVSIDALEQALESTQAEALHDLGLHLGRHSFAGGDALCRLLPAWRIVPRLSKLDLSDSGITDAGGAALLAQARALAHLERLDLSRNLLSEGYLSGSGARLRGLCRQVALNNQIRIDQG